MTDKSIFVLYGSQTGNAESIAKDLFSQLRETHSSNEIQCLPLNQFKGFVKREGVEYLLLIACSTTGNGDSPENCDAWWRSVKLRSAAKDLFSSMSYSILGLGDTNYDKFCYIGKSVDKRLHELGGERLLPLECADEATNLEETVERWRHNVALAVKKFLTRTTVVKAKDEITPIPHSSETAINPANPVISLTENLPKNDVSLNAAGNSSLENIPQQEASTIAANNKAHEDHFVVKEQEYVEQLERRQQTIPAGLSSLRTVALATSVCSSAEEFDALVGNHVQAPSRGEKGNKHDSVVIEVISANTTNERNVVEDVTKQLHAQSLQDEHKSVFGLGCSADHVFNATVLSAKWLTDKDMSLSLFHESPENWGSGKRVVALNLCLSGSEIEYAPGDALAVCCPNPSYAVQVVLARLKQSDAALEPSTLVKYTASGKSEILTLQELLSFRLDLCALPKKTQLAMLARLCSDPVEKQMLGLVTGRETPKKQLFTHFVEEQNLNIAEILYLFPSCSPTLTDLVQILLPLVPRYYSVASSPLAQGDMVTVAFSLVRYQCRVAVKDSTRGLPAILRSGVCTSFLEGVLAPWLYGNQHIDHKVTLKVFHRSTPHFHLPASVATPMLLIGPGTGVAPFIGFLQHREAQQKDRLQRLHPCHSQSHDKHLDTLDSKNSNNSAETKIPSEHSVQDLATKRKRRILAVSELMSEGVWRGGFELDSEDLPSEGNGVESFLDKVQCGDISLYFGCRDERDFLFHDFLQEHLVNASSNPRGVLTHLHVGFSRKPGQEKVYVTQLLQGHSVQVAQLLMERQGAIYICGDGTGMAKDVMATLARILVTQGHCEDETAAQTLLNSLKTRKRLNLDIWS